MPGHFRSLRFSGAKIIAIIYIKNFLIYIIGTKWPEVIFLMTDNDRSLMTWCSPLPWISSPTLERLHFTRFRKTEFKLPEKYYFLQHFFVPLHQQSKESYFVPKGGHLWRPRQGAKDDRRRSSMKTLKRTRKASGKLWLNKLFKA